MITNLGFNVVLTADPSTLYTSEIKTLSGLTGSTFVSIDNGEVAVNGVWSNTLQPIADGDTLQIRSTTDTGYDKSSSRKVSFFDANGILLYFCNWTIVHKAARPKAATGSLNAAPLQNRHLNVEYFSAEFVLSGVETSLDLLPIGGQVSVNGSAYTSTAQTANPGDKFQVKLTTGTDVNLRYQCVLEFWKGGLLIDSKKPLTVDCGSLVYPQFTNIVTDAAPGSIVTSDVISPNIDMLGYEVSVVNGSFIKLGDPEQTTPYVHTNNGEQFIIVQTASSTGGTTEVAELIFSFEGSEQFRIPFSVTTIASLPVGVLSDLKISNASPSVEYYSEDITVPAGGPYTISITDGSYSIYDGVGGETGPFTSSEPINGGDSFYISLFSSAANAGVTSTVVSITDGVDTYTASFTLNVADNTSVTITGWGAPNLKAVTGVLPSTNVPFVESFFVEGPFSLSSVTTPQAIIAEEISLDNITWTKPRNNTLILNPGVDFYVRRKVISGALGNTNSSSYAFTVKNSANVQTNTAGQAFLVSTLLPTADPLSPSVIDFTGVTEDTVLTSSVYTLTCNCPQTISFIDQNGEKYSHPDLKISINSGAFVSGSVAVVNGDTVEFQVKSDPIIGKNTAFNIATFYGSQTQPVNGGAGITKIRIYQNADYSPTGIIVQLSPALRTYYTNAALNTPTLVPFTPHIFLSPTADVTVRLDVNSTPGSIFKLGSGVADASDKIITTSSNPTGVTEQIYVTLPAITTSNSIAIARLNYYTTIGATEFLMGSTYFYTVTPVDQRTDLEPVVFTPQTVSTPAVFGYTSNLVTISGINTIINARIIQGNSTGTEISINNGPFSSSATTSPAGLQVTDVIRMRVTQDPLPGQTLAPSLRFEDPFNGNATLLEVPFTVEMTGGADGTPDAFSFTPATDVPLSTQTISDVATITGIADTIDWVVVGGQARVQGGTFTNSGTINNNETLELRVLSSSSFSTPATATITLSYLGTTVATQSFIATTLAVDSTPTAFSFTPVIDAAFATVYLSNEVTLSGVNVALDYVVTGPGELLINDVVVTNTGTIQNGDTFKFNLESANAFSTPEITNIQLLYQASEVANQSFSVTTLAADNIPDALSFTSLTDQPLSTVVQSVTRIVGGINTTVGISTVNGEVSINGGPWVTTGNVVNGDSLSLRVTTSASNSTDEIVDLDFASGYSTSFTATTLAFITDATPAAFDFTDATDIALSTLTESNSVVISGINVPVGISVSSGEYIIDGGTPTSSPGLIGNGQSLKLRHTSAATHATPVIQTVSFSDGATTTLSVDWQTLTIPVPLDTVPDAIVFTPVTGVATSSLNVSNTETISGINVPLLISIVGGEFEINGGGFVSVPASIEAGDTLTVRLTADTQFETEAIATVSLSYLGVEQATSSFSVTTLIPDVTPDVFSFPAVTNATVNSPVISSAVGITGFQVPLQFSISGGLAIKNGGGTYTNNGTINENDTLTLRQVSSTANSTEQFTTVTLTYNSVTVATVQWSVTTEAIVVSSIPNALTFAPEINAALNTQFVSNIQTVTGINVPLNVTITGGEYSINGGAYVSGAGIVINDDVLRLRAFSSGTYETVQSIIVEFRYLGNLVRTATYTITTGVNPVDNIPDLFSFTPVVNANISTVYTSNSVTISGINVPISISIVGGTYSKNSGPFVNSVGTVSNGDIIVLRVLTGTSYNALSMASITLNSGITEGFSVTTKLPTSLGAERKLIYIGDDGLNARTQSGDLSNLGGTTHDTFTVGGKEVLLSGGTTGNLVTGYEHTQVVPASSWIIQHAKNTKNIHFTVYNDQDDFIIPNTTSFPDINTIQINFGQAVSGRAILIMF